MEYPRKGTQGSLKPNSSKWTCWSVKAPPKPDVSGAKHPDSSAESTGFPSIPWLDIQPLDARNNRAFRAERSQSIGSQRRRAGATRQPLGTLESQPSLLATSLSASWRAKQEPSRFCHMLTPSWLQSVGWEMLAQWSRAGNRESFPARSSPHHPGTFVRSTLPKNLFNIFDRATRLVEPIPTSP